MHVPAGTAGGGREEAGIRSCTGKPARVGQVHEQQVRLADRVHDGRTIGGHAAGETRAHDLHLEHGSRQVHVPFDGGRSVPEMHRPRRVRLQAR
jgi:hypothetical protein